MNDISEVPTKTLREAAAAWRKAAPGIGMFGRGPISDLHDRIDDMVEEIARLRALAATITGASEPHRTRRI